MIRGILMIVLAGIIAACAVTGATPAQQAVTTTANTCKSVSDSIAAVDAMVLNKSISKANATTAANALTIAQTGCVTALTALQAAAASAGSAPASGVK